MDPSGGSSQPSLWVFLIIVLAVLLGVVLSTSFVMHMVQRRQRRQLERRIANGEVDLEMLGIKRLNVPPEVVEKMPQYTFKSIPADDLTPAARNARQQLFQPTCSICLDDFVYDETQVRELPCKHIFHPECIDPFLRENSSLCPLCKRSTLPAGFCPIEVTNVMVRRERLSRRLQAAGGRPLPGRTEYRRYQPPPPPTPWSRRLDRLRGPSVVSAPERAVVRGEAPPHGVPQMISEVSPEDPNTEVELGPIESHDIALPDNAEPPPEIARRGTVARRAWRRERVASMHARAYDEQAEMARREDERRPLWRRALGVA